MQKTRKSIMARFKITGTGKAMHRTPGRRHLLRNKTRRQLATSKGDKAAAKFVADYLRKTCCPKAF